MYMVHSHILQHKDYYKVHSFICVLFYNKNKWVRAENNSETKKCTKSCDEISIAIPQIVDGKKNQVNFTDSGNSLELTPCMRIISYMEEFWERGFIHRLQS